MEASVVDELAARRADEEDLGAKEPGAEGDPGDEQPNDDTGSEPESPVEPEPGKKMTQMALFEGHRVSKILLTFSGSVEVTDPELIERLRIGQDLELSLAGSIEQRNHGRTKDGLKAVSVFKPASVALVD